jgi:hypothetical protein
LIEEWAFPLDGSYHGIRDASSVLGVGDRLLLLDARTEKIHVVSGSGRYLTSIPVRRLSDGSLPYLLAHGPDDSLLLASYNSSSCRLLPLGEDREPEDCSFSDDLEFAYDIQMTEGELAVFGKVRGSDEPVHIFRWEDGTWGLDRSFGKVHSLSESGDSLRLLRGVGIGCSSQGVFYTQINPIELEFWGINGEKVWAEKPVRGLAPLSEFRKAAHGNEVGVLSPLIPHANGIDAWGEFVLVSAYSPAKDSSSLWVFRRDGSEVSSLHVPFELRVRGHVGGILALERWIGEVELAGYSMESGEYGGIEE